MFNRLSRICGAALFCGAVGLLLTGCGGDQIGSAGNNPYAATYVGRAVDSSGNVSSVNLTITNTGAVAGSSVTNIQSSSINGTISSKGVASMSNITGSNLSSNLVGTFSAPAASTIYATLTNATNNSTTYIVLLGNPTVAQTGGNLFAGDYVGTDTVASTGKTGPFAFAVDPLGKVTGTMILTVKGVVETAIVTGIITSQGSCNISLAPLSGLSLGTAIGSLTLMNTSVSGTLTANGGTQIGINLRVVS